MDVLGKEHLLHLPPPLRRPFPTIHPSSCFPIFFSFSKTFLSRRRGREQRGGGGECRPNPQYFQCWSPTISATTASTPRSISSRSPASLPLFFCTLLPPASLLVSGNLLIHWRFIEEIDNVQVLGEARRHKREASRSIDSIHFKLQKPISKDDHHHHHSRRQPLKKRKWWRNALLFFRGRWAPRSRRTAGAVAQPRDDPGISSSPGGPSALFRASISGPVYLSESRSELGTPYGTARRPSSGPLAGTLTPSGKGDLGIPYLNLRELNMEQYQQQRVSASAAMPIYLVT